MQALEVLQLRQAGPEGAQVYAPSPTSTPSMPPSEPLQPAQPGPSAGPDRAAARPVNEGMDASTEAGVPATGIGRGQPNEPHKDAQWQAALQQVMRHAQQQHGMNNSAPPAPGPEPATAKKTVYSSLESLGHTQVASPDLGIVKHRSKKHATILLSPAHLIHVPRTFLQEHFNLSWVLANGLDVQIDADGTLDPEVVHATVANYQNKSGYSYHRLLGFKGVCRKYMNWRVIGWQAVDHQTVRLCISKPSPEYMLPVKVPEAKKREKRVALDVNPAFPGWQPPAKNQKLSHPVAIKPEQLQELGLSLTSTSDMMSGGVLNLPGFTPAHLPDSSTTLPEFALSAHPPQVRVLAIDSQMLCGSGLNNQHQVVYQEVSGATEPPPAAHDSRAAGQEQLLVRSTGTGTAAGTSTWVTPEGVQVWSVPLNGSSYTLSLQPQQQRVSEPGSGPAALQHVTATQEQYTLVDVSSGAAHNLASHGGMAQQQQQQQLEQHMMAGDGTAVVTTAPVQYVMLGEGGAAKQVQESGVVTAGGGGGVTWAGAAPTTGGHMPTMTMSSSSAGAGAGSEAQHTKSAFTSAEPAPASGTDMMAGGSMGMSVPGAGCLAVDASGQTVYLMHGPNGIMSVPVVSSAAAGLGQATDRNTYISAPANTHQVMQQHVVQQRQQAPVQQQQQVMQLPNGQVVMVRMQQPQQPQHQQPQQHHITLVNSMPQPQRVVMAPQPTSTMHATHHVMQQQQAQAQPTYITYTTHQPGTTHVMPTADGSMQSGSQQVRYITIPAQQGGGHNGAQTVMYTTQQLQPMQQHVQHVNMLQHGHYSVA